MISKCFGRLAALMIIALTLANSSALNAQKLVTLNTTQAGELLAATDASALRNKLITLNSGKAGAVGTAEQLSFSQGGKSVRFEYASQLITYKGGNAEQITIKITENSIVNTINLVQYDNGQIGILDGTSNLSVRSLRSNIEDCLDSAFGAGSACAACETKIKTCFQNNTRVIRMLQCMLRSIDGNCISCGIDMYTISACFLVN